ncbi:hypothetical protein [Chryseobacterium sp. UNC8MFCol]|uniref:hypothetical protein n=1 Tax=Chryseobacterium sp. UNC8MFCol TaxID=1340435 RepID=UPI0012DCAFCD|nr:hypothetical protein [Chryseobacterium sp. UNC8MFCol]
MNNTERAFAVARLFPDHFGTLTDFIKTEIAHLRERAGYQKSVATQLRCKCRLLVQACRKR